MLNTKKLLLSVLGLTILVGTINVDAASRFSMRRFTGAVAPTAMQAVPVFGTSFRNCSRTLKPWEKLPMDATVRDVRYDETFKILFGESGAEARAISFLNAVLAPEKNDDRIKNIRYLDGTLNSAVDRTLHFDIKIESLCETFNGNRFIIEMQKAQVPGHINRWVYYGARELSMMGERNYEKARDAVKSEEKKKLHARHYQRLDPVKVVTILDFDNLKTEEELCNAKDIVVHWDIRERDSKKISSNLLSWTYVMLPRFVEKLSQNKSLNFKDKPLDAWLYLMTREDEEQVHVTGDMTNNDSALAEGFHRISHLSKEERAALHAGKMAYTSRISREEEKFEEGEAKGKIEGIAEGVVKGKIEMLIDEGLTNGQILKRLQPKHPTLSIKQIERFRAL